MRQIINIEKWERKEHFEFFKNYNDPLHGLVANINCTNALNAARSKGFSFHTYLLHCVMRAINSVDAFKYRYEDGYVVRYSTIHCGTTLPSENGMFKMACIPFNENFEEFAAQYKETEAKLKPVKGLNINEETNRFDIIHYSAVPWVSFTSLTHARFTGGVECPKVSTGKYFEQNGITLIPVAVNAHHSFVYGHDMGLFYTNLQSFINGEEI